MYVVTSIRLPRVALIRCAPAWSSERILSCASVGSRWNKGAMAPAAIGVDIDVPSETPCVASTCRQRRSDCGQFALVKTLVGVPGVACALIGATIAAPGATMSGLGMPFAFGPAL